MSWWPGPRAAELLGARVVEVEPITRKGGEVPRVWRIRLVDGREVAAKQAVPAEGRAWRWLFERAPAAAGPLPLPRLLQWDAAADLLITEWYPGLPLDDWLQESGRSAVARQRVADSLTQAVGALENAFEQARATGATLVPAGGGQEPSLPDGLRLAAQAAAGLVRLAELVNGPRPDPGREAARGALARAFGAAAPLWGAGRPVWGPLDCNARNVLVGPAGEVRIVDLAQVGPDVPAARRVRYATATGAYRPDGRFASLLDAQTVPVLAGGDSGFAAALDAWDLIALGQAAVQLVIAWERPEDPAVQTLRAAWGALGRRAAGLAALAVRPVSGEPRLRAVREAVGQLCGLSAPDAGR